MLLKVNIIKIIVRWHAMQKRILAAITVKILQRLDLKHLFCHC